MGDEVSMGKGGRPRVETLVSAGGVVYRCVNGRIETVLCGLAGPAGSGQSGPEDSEVGGRDQGEKVRWALAKGTPDPGETLEETALREVREETGLEVELDAPLGSIEYWFADRDDPVRYHKTVHFYLMVPIGGDTELHDPEFDVVRWFPSDTALKVLAYANEVQVLRRALELIAKREGG
jgi:8-oxo-dGTP pyrophosphatase MutT (NUDIX family)